MREYYRRRLEKDPESYKASRREGYQRNRAKYIERSKRNWAENKETEREKRKEYRARNAEKIAAAKAKYYRENREERAAYAREYREGNKHVIDKYRAEWLATEAGQLSTRAIQARRRETPFTDEALAYIASIVNDPCSYCGGPAGEVDHIVAVRSGGTGDWDNLASACRSCNASKGDKSLLRFLLVQRERGT